MNIKYLRRRRKELTFWNACKLRGLEFSNPFWWRDTSSGIRSTYTGKQSSTFREKLRSPIPGRCRFLITAWILKVWDSKLLWYVGTYKLTRRHVPENWNLPKQINNLNLEEMITRSKLICLTLMVWTYYMVLISYNMWVIFGVPKDVIRKLLLTSEEWLCGIADGSRWLLN
jgi:hypothetical protein